MYKRTKFSIPFYPAYINAYEYYRKQVPDVAVIDEYEEWLESQGAHFHRRDPHMKQNHKIFFDTDEQRIMFLLKVSG